MSTGGDARRTALVVEDDPAFLALLAQLLDDEGFTTTAFDRGQPALAAVNERHFDLLLVDQWLPDLNGIQICERAHERYGNTAAIFLVTADRRIEHHVTALATCADDDISKPFHVDILLARIEAKLRSNGRAAE